MNKTLTCVICPNGCQLIVDYEGVTIQSVEGALCSKGNQYAEQEILDPKRNIASSVRVTGGKAPLVSVRLTGPIPKKKIFDVMAEIRALSVDAPVVIGQVLITDVSGLGQDVIATKRIDRI